jgi:hypothetical protein
MSTLGWLASVSSSVFVMTTLIEAIIDVAKSDFGFTNWQYTLTMLGFLLITIAFNTWGAKALPMMETVSLYGHLLGFLVVMLPLLIMAPKIQHIRCLQRWSITVVGVIPELLVSSPKFRSFIAILVSPIYTRMLGATANDFS